MTLPASGAINTDQILAELRIANPSRIALISTDDTDVRSLAGVQFGTLIIPDHFWGKSVAPSYTPMSGQPISADATDPATTTHTVQIPVHATFNGGNAPYNIVWAHTGGSGTINQNNSVDTFANMTIQRNAANGSTVTQNVSCTITDAANNTLVLNGTVTLTSTAAN